MKKLLAIFSFVVGTLLVINGCKKVDPLVMHNDGKVVSLTASISTVAPAVADSNKKILAFSWSNPEYATDPKNYKFVIEIDSTGRNFSKATRREVLGKMTDSITGRELNAMLLNYGFTLGTPYVLDVRVLSSYANNNERYTSNTVKVTVTPYSDPSVFSSNKTAVTGTLATAAQNALTFSWTASFTGYPGTVTYTLQYDSSGKNFASPQEIAVGASIFSRGMTEGEINTTALNENVAGGSVGKIEYRVKAVTAQGGTAFSNAVAVTINTYVPLLRFYMPGSYQAATGNGTDWEPANAPEFVRDLRPAALNKLYYMYIFLPANSAFKITQGRSWNVNYGGTGGNLVAGGADLTVTTAGVYRISIDVANMKYDIRQGRMGFVGDAVGTGWTPPNIFPTYAMGHAANNLFVGLTNFSGGGGWKLLDYNDWNNGSITATDARSYGATGASGSTMEVNGANMPNVTTAGRYRVIWDGRDVNNIKYEISPATEMRVVGDGINQAGVSDWDPPTSPQMTYSGNGVWTISITLKAGKSIKFLAGNAWGAFDYEDQSGLNTLGVARKISWNSGGGDFKTPAAAGTYTITLNEYTQTVTIN
jgi:hypothetical protein